MNNNKGTIYLIQPVELFGSDTFKIGCSSKNDLDRLKKGYKKGTRFLDIRECDDPFTIERVIKKIFKSKFKLVAGREYFQGHEIDIKREFNDIVSNMIIYDKDTSSDEEEYKDPDCYACRDTGTSYWSDGVYGNCLECCCIDCGKKNGHCICIECICTKCGKSYWENGIYGDCREC